MFYLVIILFGVGWILISIVRNYISSKSPISHKYLNHGKDVPVQKYSNVRSPISNVVFTPIRAYSTNNKDDNHAHACAEKELNVDKDISSSSTKIYAFSYSMKKRLLMKT